MTKLEEIVKSMGSHCDDDFDFRLYLMEAIERQCQLELNDINNKDDLDCFQLCSMIYYKHNKERRFSMTKRTTKSFLVADEQGGFYCLRGRTLREAVSKALTPRGDFRYFFHAGSTLNEMMENLLGKPVFESEAWIWPIEWTKEQREYHMRH